MNYSLILSLLALAVFHCCRNKSDVPPAPLNLASLIQPIGKYAQYTEPGYATWDGNLHKEGDTYYLI